MNLNTRAARRHDTHNDSRAGWRERLRTSVAMLALSTLALAGVSALVVAPASAEEAPPAAVVCIDPQVVDLATQECVDPPADDGVGEGEGTVETDLLCESPMVLDEAGTACVDPPANTGSDPPADALTCDDGMVLNETADACVAPPEGPPVDEPMSALKVTDDTVGVTAVDNPKKIQFCHRTAADGNPYVYLDTSIQAFFNSGHISHTGPIYPAEGPDGFWGDIYPPNQYDADGQNWNDEGIAIFENDCAVGENPPDNPGVDVEPGACVLYESTQTTVALTNLEAENEYELWLDDVLKDSGPGTESIGFQELLPAGDYVLTVKMFDSTGQELLVEFTVEFTVEACPKLDIDVTPETCSLGDDGVATLYFAGLVEGEDYTWAVEGEGDYSEGGTFTASGAIHSVTLDNLPPDHYYASIEWDGVATLTTVPEPKVFDDTSFTIEPCEPDIKVDVTQCVVKGGSGSALVSLSGLVEGVQYEVWVTAQGDKNGPTFGDVETVTGDANGEATVNFASLPAPGEYTAWVEGEFEWPETVTLLTTVDPGYESVVLKDHIDFVLQPCPDLDLEVRPDACSLGDDGIASLLFSGLLEGEDYSWYVSGNDGYFEEGSFEATGDTHAVTLSDLPPDHFYAYVENGADSQNLSVATHDRVWAEAWFEVEPCEPDITVTVTECTANGSTGSALVSLSGLVDGVEYDVWVTKQGDEAGPVFGTVHTVTGDADGKAHVNVTSLPAPGKYTAWVEGEFTWPSGVTLLSALDENGHHDTVTLKDHVDFALKACPPPLPATGSDPIPGLAVSLLLVGAGGLALVAGRLRRLLG